MIMEYMSNKVGKTETKNSLCAHIDPDEGAGTRHVSREQYL
jgi:hypothetical protein